MTSQNYENLVEIQQQYIFLENLLIVSTFSLFDIASIVFLLSSLFDFKMLIVNLFFGHTLIEKTLWVSESALNYLQI